MKSGKLLFIFLLVIAIGGCQRPDLRKIFINLGVYEPIFSDVDYSDKALQALFEEIHSYGEIKTLIVDEYNWIELTSVFCNSNPSQEESECLIQQNNGHRKKLEVILTAKLISFSAGNIKNKEINLPDGMNVLSVSDSHRYSPQMAYTPKANILIYQAADGKLYAADLNIGKYLSSFNDNYSTNGFKSDLKISSNGRILLTRYNDKIELVSVRTGNKLAHIEGYMNAQFTKNDKYLLAWKQQSAVLLDVKNLEPVGSTFEYPSRQTELVFDSSTNVIFTWGRQTNKVSFNRVDDESVTFESIKDIVLDRVPKNHFTDAIFSPKDKVGFVFTYNYIYKVNMENGSYYELMENPFVGNLQRATVQDGFIVGKGFLPERKRIGRYYVEYIDILDVVNGTMSSIELPDIKQVRIISTPISNTVLIGKGKGVKKFTINENELKFTVSQSVTSKNIAVKKSRTKSQKNINTVTKSGYIKTFSRGSAGIDDALRLGYLRTATDKDISTWSRKNKLSGKILKRIKYLKSYVVLKPLKLTGGLSGANSVAFIAMNSRIAPFGNVGHSAVLFSDTGACKGVMCRVQ